MTNTIPVPRKTYQQNRTLRTPQIFQLIKKTLAITENLFRRGVSWLNPAHIYVEEQSQQFKNPILTRNHCLCRIPVQEDEPVIEMHLVVKDSHQAAEEKPIVQQTQPIMMSNVEEPAMQDETEELRRRAMDRIAKLRNLSFNINAADPNNEFETVPAYLRRNMELHNSNRRCRKFLQQLHCKVRR